MATEPWQEVADLAARLAAEQDYSGIIRVTRGEEVLLEACHGLANRADGIPVRPSTRFATASLAKVFTAIGILDAAGRGELGIRDRVIDVLPADKRPSTLREDVLVHHLLSHSSGIADYFEEDEELPDYREDYGDIWDRIPNYRVRDYAALLPLFADLPPNFPPGDVYHYSNAGYVLLGILLQEVSGMPFAQAIESRVFVPAGMNSSGYLAFDEVHPDVAAGYLAPLTPGGPWRTNIYSVHPVGGGDGGAMVTAEDVERCLRAVHRGGVWRGVRPEEMLARHTVPDGRWSCGYGVYVRDDGVFAKDGGDPGVSTYARYIPSTDTTVVALANVDESSVPGLEDLADLLIDTADA